MGCTYWSDEHYRSQAAFRRARGLSAFAHDADIRAQKVRPGVHPKMDPAGLKSGRRESRDSDAHPESHAVAVLFDVTGSMREVPQILQKNLTTLFGLCLRRGYLAHPAILVGGIGDATCDAAPLQVGQFESGNEIEDDLSRLYLEGGGGGQMTESYELALYFLARKTAIDCVEKRGRKGYAFLIGDEMPYRHLKRDEVERVFGDVLEEDVPIQALVREAREKWELFFVIPKLSSYYDDPRILNCWRGLFGQNVFRLEDPAGISELIASTIGLAEDAVKVADLAGDLDSAGVKPGIVKAVSSALLSAGAATVPGTGLRVTGGGR
jgi:hypothetical protein